jgi:hypothetical protein
MVDSTISKGKCVPIAVVALLVFSVVMTVWFISKEYAYRDKNNAYNVQSDSGVWDLHGYDLNTQIQFLAGEVEYAPNALLTPKAFGAYSGEIVRGYIPPDMKAATARLMLLVKPGRYMLSANSIDYNERIFINGVFRQQVGQPGLTAADSVAAAQYMKFDVYANDGVIEIVRQSSNFVHKENSGFSGFWIGGAEIMRRMIALQEMPSAIMVGLYMALFLTHLTAYLLFRDYRPNLWFAVICFAGFLSEGFFGRKIYWSMFPGLPWEAVYRVCCCAAVLANVMILLLLRDEFPGLVHKWARRSFMTAYAALAVFFLFAYTVLISYAKRGVEILIVLLGLYIAVRLVCGRARVPVSAEQILTAIGLTFALATFLHDALRYNNLTLFFHYETADMGILALILFQTAAMFHGAMRKYADAKRETEKLAAKTDFYRRMSHQLRTPLTVISTGVQVALRRPDEAPELLN